MNESLRVSWKRRLINELPKLVKRLRRELNNPRLISRYMPLSQYQSSVFVNAIDDLIVNDLTIDVTSDEEYEIIVDLLMNYLKENHINDVLNRYKVWHKK